MICKKKRNFRNVWKKKTAYDPNKIDLEHISHMYKEDWHSGILPFRKDNFKVKFAPADSKNMVTTLFRRNQHGSNSPERSLEGFLREATQLMQLDSFIAYEICESEIQGHFQLHPISSETLKISGNIATQTIDKDTYEVDANYFYEGRLDDIFIIDVPSWLESGAGFKTIISALKEESNRSRVSTKFLTENPRHNKTHFDFNSFNAGSNREVLKLTKDSGWDLRQVANGRITEFYWVFRSLKFDINQARLREYIIDRINISLIPKLKAKGVLLDKIELTGILTYSDLIQKQKDLMDGNIGFHEALNLVDTKNM